MCLWNESYETPNDRGKGPTRRTMIWVQCSYGGPLDRLVRCLVRANRSDATILNVLVAAEVCHPPRANTNTITSGRQWICNKTRALALQTVGADFVRISGLDGTRFSPSGYPLLDPELASRGACWFCCWNKGFLRHRNIGLLCFFKMCSTASDCKKYN